MQETKTDVISSADLHHYFNNFIISVIYNRYKVGWVGEGLCRGVGKFRVVIWAVRLGAGGGRGQWQTQDVVQIQYLWAT